MKLNPIPTYLRHRPAGQHTALFISDLMHCSVSGRRMLLTLVAVILSLCASAQLTLDTNATASILANRLVGSGVTVSNPVLNCPIGASATFTGGSATHVGVSDGIFLCNGQAELINLYHDSLANVSFFEPGDNDLGVLLYNLGVTDTTTMDACVLEFDVRPVGDTLSFKYVFASDEYDSFTCSTYTDMFGFFITGPNPAGGTYNTQNIALIPGTTLPVAINTVNGGSATGQNFGSDCISLAYSQYFRRDTTICYGGSTIPLNAVVAVRRCQNYHLKLAVSDVGDSFLDSGVFIQGGSLSSNGAPEIKDVIVDHQLEDPVRGCAGATIEIVQSRPSATTTTVHYQIRGTAVNGTDYTHIADSVVFAPHDTIAHVYINPLMYAGAQSGRTVILYLYDNACGLTPYDSVAVTIQDSIHFSISAPSVACLGSTIHLYATGVPSCVWHPGAGLSDSTVASPTARMDSSVTYIATFSTGTCTVSDTVHITVGAAIQMADSITLCMGGSYTFGGSTLTAPGVYHHTFTSLGGCDSIVTLTLRVDTPVNLSFSRQLCAGDSFLFAGHYRHTTGTYRDTVVLGPLCYDITTLTLSVVPYLHTTLTATLCPGASVVFAGQTITTPGVYSDSLVSVSGCDSIVTMTVDTAPVWHVAASAVVCSGRALQFGGLAITAPGTYIDTFSSRYGCDSIVTLTVDTASSTAAAVAETLCEGAILHYHHLTITVAGTYMDTLVNASGCDSVVTLTVTLLPRAVDTIAAVVCSGGSYTFGGRTLTASGTYRDTATAVNGCDSITILQLDLQQSPMAGFVIQPAGPSVELGPIYVTDHSQRADSLLWLLNDQFISLRSGGRLPVAGAGTYCLRLVAITDAGCRDTSTECITVFDSDLFMPNAFTPNGDGINDVVELYGSRAGIKLLSVNVFDRWGEKVFESNDLNFRWDGTYRSVLQEPGIFVYMLNVTFQNGRDVKTKGSIMLIR